MSIARSVFVASCFLTLAYAQTDFRAELQTAVLLEKSGQLLPAEKRLKSLLPLASNPAEKAVVLNELGQISKDKGRYPEATQRFRQAIELANDSSLAASALPARLTLNLASTLIEAGRFSEAAALDPVKQKERLTEPFDRAHADATIAALWLAEGKLEAAHKLYTKCLEYFQSSHDPVMDIDIATTLNNLGTIALQRNEPEKSVAYLEESTQRWRAIAGKEHPLVTKSLCNLGYAQLRARRYAEAAASLEAAYAGLERSPDWPGELLSVVRADLAKALEKAGRSAEARRWKKPDENAWRGRDNTVHVSDLLETRKSGQR